MKRFVVLDSWRGIAACLVALFHFSAASHIERMAFIRNAHLFVDFFFVLSGFVISAAYARKLAQGFGIGRFMLLRFGRVYPLHIALLGAFIMLKLLKVAVPGLAGATGNKNAAFAPPLESIDTIIANVALVQGLNIFGFLSWNNPSWSISAEFYTYLLFALCIVFLKPLIPALLIVAVTAGPALIALYAPRGMDSTFDYGMIRCLYGFAAGVLAWELYRRAGERIRILRGSLAESLVILAVVLFVAFAGSSRLAVAAPYVFAVAVLVFAGERGAVSRVLSTGPFLLLGTLSYSIYMVHFMVVNRFYDLLTVMPRLGVDPNSLQAALGWNLFHGDAMYVIYLGLVVLVSVFTYRWIEEPCREWFRRLAMQPEIYAVGRLGTSFGLLCRRARRAISGQQDRLKWLRPPALQRRL